MRGTVDSVVADNGFGFITGEDGQQYFFHRTALKAVDWDQIAPGVVVNFAQGEDAGDRPGEHPRAVDVRLAEDSPVAVDNELLPPEKAPDTQR